ncbi:MAG: hypothetical protein CL840_22060 [Crocinitomicaceae bacterium]|nr:hypothetical protein [Crocinitomicaceae bacterium]
MKKTVKIKMKSMKNVYGIVMLLVGVLFVSAEAFSQYCTPRRSATWGYISSVKTTGGTININKSGTTSSGYRNYTSSDSVATNYGQTFTVEVKFTRSYLCWIDWNDDGDFADAGELIKTGPQSTRTNVQTETFSVTVPNNAAYGSLRMRVYSNYYYYASIGRDPSGCGYSNYQGEIEDYRISIPKPPKNDAGITEMTPAAACAGSNAIQVRIMNFGIDTMKSVTISGTIKEIGGATTTYGPTTLTGLAIPRLKDTLYTVTNYTIAAGKSYDMDFQTSSPNSSTDSNTTNDKISKIGFSAALGGTYTIGASSGADYNTFKAAEADMKLKGICAPTIFNVEAGTYNEQVKFTTYVGISATNNVRFRPHPSNTAPVRLTYSSTSSGNGNRGTVVFNRTQHIAMDSITIEAKGGSYANVIEFQNAPKNLSFTGDSLIGNQTSSTTSNWMAIVYDYQTYAENMTFRKNVMLGGSSSFYIYGRGSTNQTGGYYKIEDNIMSGFNYMGIYCYYRSNNDINRNVISNSGRYNYPRGLHFYYCNKTSIRGNNIQIKANNYAYGIYHYRCYGTSTARQEVKNNMIAVTGGSGWHWPLYEYYANYTDISFNSVSNEKGNSYQLYLYYGTSVTFRNNIIANFGNGYRYRQYGSQTRSNNVWWAPTATSFNGNLGSNVLNVDPKYKSFTDLHSRSTAVHNSGVAVTGVTMDIDGDTRCPGTGCPGAATAPDRGADEFWLPDYDISPTTLGDKPCSGTQNVQIYVSNVGVKPLTSFTVNWSIGGVAQTALSVTGSNVAAGADTLVTLGTHNFVSGTAYNFEYITSAPSGQTDQQQFNDTLRETLQNALSGTFTVGTAASDYADFTTAFADLVKFGVCGPVRLQIKDTTLIENFTIGKIPGNSSSNTITMEQDPTNTNPGELDGNISLDNVTHLTIKNMIFNTTGNAIVFNSGQKVTNLKVDSNTFNLGQNSGSALWDGFYEQNMDSVWFTNNTVNLGNYIVRFYGGSSTQKSSKEGNIYFENNKCHGWTNYGVYAFYCFNLHVNNNEIISDNSGYPWGVYSYYNDNVEIIKNNIWAGGTTGGYGLYCYSNNRYGSSSDSLKLINNYITAGSNKSTSTRRGAYIYYYNYRAQIYHNNIAVHGSNTSGTREGMYTYFLRNSDVKNNIFYCMSGTTWNERSSSSVTRDYNAYWTGNPIVSGKSGPTMGTNSMITNPRFKDPEKWDLRVNSIQLDSAATNVGVADDIYGMTRVLGSHDIGAHEFDPCYFDAVAKEYYARYRQIPNTQSVRMYGRVSNVGLDTITGVSATASVGTNTINVPLGSILSDGDSAFSVAVPLTGASGVVNASMYTAITETDCDLLNDSAKYAFIVSDTVYAYDDSTVNNRLGFNSPGTGEFGSVFEIFNADTISSGTFYLNGPVQGATVRLLVYEFIDSTQMPGNIVDSTRSFIVGKSGTGWYTLQFGCAGIVAQPGKYLVTIEQSNPVRMELGIDVNGVGVPATRWERATGGTWNDLYNSTSNNVKNAVLALRVNLGQIKENDLLPNTSLICNNSSTYLKLNAKYDRQLWSNGYLFDSILVSTPGVYKVTAWDAIGCKYSDSTTATMATPMNVTTTPVKATCGQSDGSVTLAVTGAYPPHSYAWSTGATTQNLSNVAGDDYTVVIKDSIGCENTQKVQVLGAFPLVSNSWTYPTCNGDGNGTATASVDKGVMPYTYQWNAGGSQNNATNVNLPSGTYVVDITDASGCVTKDTVVVMDPPVLTSKDVVTPPSACKMADASAEAQMNGGLAPYSFLWSNGQTSGKAVGLTEGVYDVTVTDSLGCVVISKMRVTDPNSPVSIPNDLTLDCSYDTTTAKVNILGGTAPYKYNWDYKNSTTSVINGVGAGTYKLHLVDRNGCDHDTSVVIIAPTAVNVNFDNIVDSAGVVKATATSTGGTPPYTWNWSPSGEATERAVNLKDGVNKVTVVDSKGCSFTYQIDVFSETTSIGYLDNTAVFNIFPNPTEGNVFVDLNLVAEENVRIKVLSSIGEVIKTIEKDNVIQDRISIDLSSFAVGIYFVETTVGTEKVISKIQLSK